MANKEGNGKIDSMEQKENRISFKIAGKYYTLWAKGEEQEQKEKHIRDVVNAIKPGDYVTFQYTEKENPNGNAPYKNIVLIKKSIAPTTNTNNGATIDPSRDIGIRRQVALKTAAEFLKSCPHVIDEKNPLDTLRGVADFCDAWLSGQLTIAVVKETIKKESPREDGAIVEENVEF